MSDPSESGTVVAVPAAVAGCRDALPGAQHTVRSQPPAPWVELSKGECLLWAMALQRAAVAARLRGTPDR